MRKVRFWILIFLLPVFFSCGKAPVEKPELLISEHTMIDMLVDIHLAESTFNARRDRDSLLKRSGSVDFYYSVLEKYQIADTVFTQSFIYYSSRHRRFEKMYRQVLTRLTEKHQEFIRRGEDQRELQIDR